MTIAQEHAILARIMGSVEMAYELWPPRRPNLNALKIAFNHLGITLCRGKLDGLLARTLDSVMPDLSPEEIGQELATLVKAMRDRKALNQRRQ